jgi:hypothetical protein
MSENPVETTATELPASNPVPATTAAPAIDVEKIEKAARQKALQEAQSKYDQREARLHKEYQATLREVKAAAANSMKKVGYDDPDAIFGDVEIRQKARRLDELQAEADNAARWQAFVNETATDYGLTPTDPRLADATSTADLQAKARAAMREDAAKEREKVLAEARAEAVAKATAKVDNGDLEVLGGAPSAPTPGLEERYKKEMQAAKGKGNNVGREIREKYRQQGVDVDYIVIR